MPRYFAMCPKCSGDVLQYIREPQIGDQVAGLVFLDDLKKDVDYYHLPVCAACQHAYSLLDFRTDLVRTYWDEWWQEQQFELLRLESKLNIFLNDRAAACSEKIVMAITPLERCLVWEAAKKLIEQGYQVKFQDWEGMSSAVFTVDWY